MRIFSYGSADITKLYGANAKKNKLERNGAGSPASDDTLQISTKARELQTYKAVLKDIPLREETVEELKTQINNGTYKPDAEKTAAGILGEMFIDEEV